MDGRGPLIVPLDGSKLAEGALPYALALSRATGARLVLVAVAEPPSDELRDHYPELARETAGLARARLAEYLLRMRREIDGARVLDTRLCDGDPASEILKTADELHARYVVLSTHGRSGLSRWSYGSVASQILHSSTVPMLVVGPHVLEQSKRDAEFNHIMVPLDGRPLSETALPFARELAIALGPRVSLVEVLSLPLQVSEYALTPSDLPEVERGLEVAAAARLHHRRAELQRISVDVHVLHGPAAEVLMSFVSRESVDLVVMATHARTGLVRALLGSVADRMLQAAAPVLLVRPSA